VGSSDYAIRSALEHLVLIKMHLSQMRMTLADIVNVGHSPQGVVFVRSSMLDVRMTIEELMLLSVSAHKDVAEGAVQAIRGKYRADYKMRKMKELNPNFFPDAIDVVPTDEPGMAGKFKSVDEPYLTEEQAKKFYHLSDNVLHASPVFMSVEAFDQHVSELKSFLRLSERLLRTFEIDISGAGFNVMGHLHLDSDALPMVVEAHFA